MSGAQTEQVHDSVFSTVPNVSDSQTLSALLDQYRLYVHSFEKVVIRRQTVHSFFLSANVLILTGLGVVAKDVAHSPPVVLIVISAGLVGTAIGLAWHRTLRSYAQLSKAKINVIRQLEQYLPAAAFSSEWDSLGRGQEPKRYYPLTKAELILPLIFSTAFGLSVLGGAVYLTVRLS